MLDFDALAELRARTLNQSHESWRTAIWSQPFQKLTQNMSDGEVESLISLCPSVPHFEMLVGFLDERTQTLKRPPFAILTDEAAKAGVTPDEWIRKGLGLAE